MQKAIFLLFSVLMHQLTSGQQNVLIIKSNSLKVDIRIDESYFAKGGWILDSTKSPDVFFIGSKWPYRTKKVSFITDIDSITFDVQAGHKYDFIILYNNKTPFLTQIAASGNPVFMSWTSITFILLAIVLAIISWYFLRHRISSKSLIKMGFAAPILFWVMTFISGYVHCNYDHLKNVVSELGAIGTRSEVFTSSALIIISLVCTFFLIGFYRISRANRLSVLPALLSFVMPVTLIWASIFTLGNELHGSTGPLPFLITAGSLLAYLFWKKDKQFLQVRKFSLISFFIMLLILFRFMTPFGYQYQGLVQRFFYLGWTIWTFAISYYFSKADFDSKKQEGEPGKD